MKRVVRFVFILFSMIMVACGGALIFSSIQAMTGRVDGGIGGELFVLAGVPGMIWLGIFIGREWALAKYSLLRPVPKAQQVVQETKYPGMAIRR